MGVVAQNPDSSGEWLAYRPSSWEALSGAPGFQVLERQQQCGAQGLRVLLRELHGDAVFFDHCIKMGTREPGYFQDFLDIGFGDSDEVLEVAPFDKRPELF